MQRHFADKNKAILLAALLWAASAASAPAQQVIPADLALVPQDAVVVLSVRCAAVAEKIGFDADPGILEEVAKTGLGLGLKGADVERVTVAFHTTWESPVVIVRTVKEVVHRRVLGALAPQCTEMTSHGKHWLVSKNDDTAIYFADDHTFVVGSKDSIPHCLDPKKHDKAAPFAAILAGAARHDAVAWSAAVPLSDLPNCRRNCCYRISPAAPPGAEFVVAHKRPCEGELKAARKKPKALFLVPADLPEWIESASATVDLGEELVVGGHLTCSDATHLGEGEKLLQLGLDALRMVSLMMRLELAGAELDGEKPPVPEGVGELIRQAETSLQATRIVHDGKTLSATAKLPASGKKLASLLQGFGEFVIEKECPRGAGCAIGSGVGAAAGALVGNSGWQAPHYPSPPQTTPPGMSTGGAVGVGYAAPATGASPVNPQPMREPLPPSSTGPARLVEPLPLASSPAPQGVQSYPAGPSGIYTPTPPPMINPVPMQLPGPATPPPGSYLLPVSSSPATPSATGSAAMAKFTIANVKKEAALLFTEGEGGKLTFVRKVPAGEAVDLESAAGTRWIAVFSDKPAGTMFTVGKPGDVVLLR
jgi:hypothetical protein